MGGGGGGSPSSRSPGGALLGGRRTLPPASWVRGFPPRGSPSSPVTSSPCAPAAAAAVRRVAAVPFPAAARRARNGEGERSGSRSRPGRRAVVLRRRARSPPARPPLGRGEVCGAAAELRGGCGGPPLTGVCGRRRTPVRPRGPLADRRVSRWWKFLLFGVLSVARQVPSGVKPRCSGASRAFSPSELRKLKSFPAKQLRLVNSSK